MRNLPFIIFAAVMVSLVLTGCSTVKRAYTTTPVSEPTAKAVSVVPSANRDLEFLSCSMKMQASINGESAKARGKLRIKVGEGIQLSATAMGLMEAACFEFLPHAVRFIYKIDKIYAEASYSSVPFLNMTGTDYEILESVILNRMFSPDDRPLKYAFESMDIVRDGDFITVTTSRSYPIVYSFFIDKKDGKLVRSEGRYAYGGNVVCIYNDFVELDGISFPRSVDISFNGDGVSASLQLDMNGLKSEEFRFSPRRVSKAYDRVVLERILESMEDNGE